MMEGLMTTEFRKCFNCDSTENITRHHLMGNGRGRIIPLCRKCHDKIDIVPYAKGMNYGLYQGKMIVVNKINRNLQGDGNGKLFINAKTWGRIKESLELLPNNVIEKAEKPKEKPIGITDKQPDEITEEKKEKRWMKHYMFE